MRPRHVRARFAVLVSIALFPGPAHAQQVTDTAFHPIVAAPAFTRRHPRLVVDQAHHNFHTLGGRYRPFGELMRRDGFDVGTNRKPFTAAGLERVEVLVIANAAGANLATGSTDAVAASAFTPEECEVVHAWVERGGALLLVADHAPFGSAAELLANRFGVDMSKGYTFDSTHADPEIGNASCLVFSRANGLLVDHPIVAGRDSRERIERVLSFTGQSLTGPPGAVPFLRLADTAVDAPFTTFAAPENRAEALAHARPAAGRAQGIAFTAGEGRVVVLGEAALLSAQRVLQRGSPPFLMGMNHPGTDDQQLALNIARWLARVI